MVLYMYSRLWPSGQGHRPSGCMEESFISNDFPSGRVKLHDRCDALDPFYVPLNSFLGLDRTSNFEREAASTIS